MTARFGFQDDQDIPRALALARDLQPELADIDPDTASYFLSRISIQLGDADGMNIWRKRLFIGLAHNAANPAAHFNLPDERTVVMASHVDL